MSTLREAMLLVADRVRGLSAPGVLDQRTVKLTIQRRVWSGGEAGLGTPTTTTLTDIPQAVDVNDVSEHEIAGSNGRYVAGAIKVGPITPKYTNVAGYSGGFTTAELDPAPTVATTGTEIIYQLTGAVVGEYRLAKLLSHDTYQYVLYLNRDRTTP